MRPDAFLCSVGVSVKVNECGIGVKERNITNCLSAPSHIIIHTF